MPCISIYSAVQQKLNIDMRTHNHTHSYVHRRSLCALTITHTHSYVHRRSLCALTITHTHTHIRMYTGDQSAHSQSHTHSYVHRRSICALTITHTFVCTQEINLVQSTVRLYESLLKPLIHPPEPTPPGVIPPATKPIQPSDSQVRCS